MCDQGLLRPHSAPAILAGDWTVTQELQKFTEFNFETNNFKIPRRLFKESKRCYEHNSFV